MANALFDMDIGVPWLYPYIGGGAGYAWTNLRQCHPGRTGRAVRLATANSTKGDFALQAIGGLSFPIPNVPGLSLTTRVSLLRRAWQRDISRSQPSPAAAPAA